MQVTKENIYSRLRTVLDPELNINLVDLGLIYDVTIHPDLKGKDPWVVITMTLTTPGCPLAAVFDTMVKDALWGLEDINVDTDIRIILTFDPPWVSDMMSEEARAELGL